MRPVPLPLLPAKLQDLAPKQARFCLGVKRFLEKELGLEFAGSRLLAGFSGGADSTALLLALHYLAPGTGFSLHAAHLDHALRPSSAAEAEHCNALCDRLSIPFVLERREVAAASRADRTGIEESARKARYAFLEASARESGCNWIVTGHTQNDLAEDILMRLIRGAGWPGLGGMPAMDGQRRLFRPLLLTPRQDIETFLSSLGVVWIEDESNRDTARLRNRVRHSLLPLLLEENPAFLDSAAGLWRLASTDRDFFAAELAKNAAAPGEPGSALFCGRQTLLALPKALRLRMYKEFLAALGPGQALLDGLLALDAAWTAVAEGKSKDGHSAHQFPGNKLALVSREGIRWQKKA